jgi:hypothetical protein
VLRNVDSSLLDEWERMLDPNYQPVGGAGLEMRPPRPEEPLDVTRDTKTFTAAIRTRVFAFLRAWSIGRDEDALTALDSAEDRAGEEWTIARLRAAREAHAVEHGQLRLDPEARNLRHTGVLPSDDGASWRIQQMLVDTEGVNDWVAEIHVDLGASRRAGQPVLRLLRLGAFAE